jgi:hypothetical protein
LKSSQCSRKVSRQACIFDPRIPIYEEQPRLPVLDENSKALHRGNLIYQGEKENRTAS